MSNQMNKQEIDQVRHDIGTVVKYAVKQIIIASKADEPEIIEDAIETATMSLITTILAYIALGDTNASNVILERVAELRKKKSDKT
jgi:hypothetical protein